MPTWRLTRGSVAQHLEQLGEFLCPQELQIVSALEGAAVQADQELIATGVDVRTQKVLHALDTLGTKLGYEV